MARKCKKQQNKRIKQGVNKMRAKRAQWKKDAVDPKLTFEQRMNAMKMLVKTRKYSSVRSLNICAITGRVRGYVRRFGVSRIMLREMMNRGEIPGIVKSSW